MIGVTPPIFGSSNSIENDKITFFAGLSLLANNLTFNQDSTWAIGNGNYTNPINVISFIPFTPAGFRRNDIFVFTTDNTVIRVAGPLTAGGLPTVAPAIPNNTVYITFVTVTENSISAPAPVINDGLYRKKIEKGEVVMTTDNLTSIILIQQETRYQFNGTQEVLTHFFDQPYNSPLYNGRDHTLTNNQLIPLMIVHNSNAYPGNQLGKKYWLKNGLNLILQPGDSAVWKWSENKNRHELVSLNGFSADLRVVEVSGDITLTPAHNNTILLILATATLTIPTNLKGMFTSLVVDVKAGVFSVASAIGVNVTGYYSLTLVPGERTSLYKESAATDNYRLK